MSLEPVVPCQRLRGNSAPRIYFALRRVNPSRILRRSFRSPAQKKGWRKTYVQMQKQSFHFMWKLHPANSGKKNRKNRQHNDDRRTESQNNQDSGGRMLKEDKEWEEWERKVTERIVKEREELKKICGGRNGNKMR